MATPALGAVAAFLIGVLATVLAYQTGFVDGYFDWLNSKYLSSPDDPRGMPLLVSVAPAGGAQDPRCPPVFEVSNDTDSAIYFLPNTGISLFANAGESSPYYDDNGDEGDDGGSYISNIDLGPGPYHTEFPDSESDNEPLFLGPGDAISTGNVRYGRRSRYGCAQPFVKIQLSN